MKPLIHIEDVFVAYGDPPRAVLAGIDLEIEEGSFVCLLGQTVAWRVFGAVGLVRRICPGARGRHEHVVITVGQAVGLARTVQARGHVKVAVDGVDRLTVRVLY